MAQQKKGFQSYLLRNVPLGIYKDARKKAKELGYSLRMYIILLLKKDLGED